MTRKARSPLRRSVLKKPSFSFFDLLSTGCGKTGIFPQPVKSTAIPWSSDSRSITVR